MNADIKTLQSIAETLEEEPLASQRVLAEKAGMSIGLMNAVLKRFVERGWIMLSNVNLRKLSYAVTPKGISELSARSQKFAKRTFELVNSYNKIICDVVSKAKNEGKTALVLYGESYIKFLLVYACEKEKLKFIEKNVDEPLIKDSLLIVGELNDEETISRLSKEGCINLLDILKV